MSPSGATARAGTRNPASALQDRVTEAITAAFFEELAEVGYGRMSVGAIVRRAGVGKAAVYRRWPNKHAMTVALISEVAVRGAPASDTGSLRGDLVALLSGMRNAMRHPLVSRILPTVAAEAGRDEELEGVLRETVEAPRRANAARIVHRAVERGELPHDCDMDLALDLMIAPLYLRMLVRRQDLDDASLERLADSLATALAALRHPA